MVSVDLSVEPVRALFLVFTRGLTVSLTSPQQTPPIKVLLPFLKDSFPPLNNSFHIRSPEKTSFLAVAMAPVPLLSTSFLFVKIFALIFLYFASILNTKTKYILFVMTATGFFNVKSLQK